MGESPLRLRLQLVLPSRCTASVLLGSKAEVALPIVRLDQNNGDFKSEGDAPDQPAVESQGEDGTAGDISAHILRHIFNNQGEVAVFALDNELGEDFGDVGIRLRHRDSGSKIPAVPSNSAGDSRVNCNISAAHYGAKLWIIQYITARKETIINKAFEIRCAQRQTVFITPWIPPRPNPTQSKIERTGSSAFLGDRRSCGSFPAMESEPKH